LTSIDEYFGSESIDSIEVLHFTQPAKKRQLRDSGPCVVRKRRFGRPIPSVETTFTRPNPVGDVTK